MAELNWSDAQWQKVNDAIAGAFGESFRISGAGASPKPAKRQAAKFARTRVKARAKSKGEDLDADSKILGRQKVAQFVDENHDPQHHDHGQNVGDNYIHNEINNT